MKSLYLECNAGISGDMLVAALLDLGADKEALDKALQSIPAKGFEYKISRVSKAGVDCCDFDVILDEEHANHDHDMAFLHGNGDAVVHSHEHEHHHDHEHEHEHEHHHDHEHEHHHDGECGCGHHHDHEEHEHHHDHEHEHHYDENGVCSCGHHHDHDHHHHHHADEVFTSWGKETPRKYSKEELEHILKTLDESEDLGMVLRAKGMLPCTDGTWMHFDLVPGEYEIRTGAADYTGRLCVIGSKLKEDKLEELFLLK